MQRRTFLTLTGATVLAGLSGAETTLQDLEGRVGVPHSLATSSQAMVASITNPVAIRAGLDALKAGGSAADAAIATSLAQIVLTGGAHVSYAGILAALYYDAESGQVTALDAGYNTVKKETDAKSIPSAPGGRHVLVPGFLAGVEALHEKFGKLPRPSLFAPAIQLAEEGFVVGSPMHGYLQHERQVLLRRPAMASVFTTSDGRLYSRGDHFRQPQLAATLTRLSSQGCQYAYRGEWAHKFVAAVAAAGGRLSLQDLDEYRVRWEPPGEVKFGQDRVLSLGGVSAGSRYVLRCLELLDLVNLQALGAYPDCAEALLGLIGIQRVCTVERYLPNYLAEYLKIEPSQLLARMRQPDWNACMRGMVGVPPQPPHSSGVVAVDARGNAVALVHTINTLYWGATGLMVEGISIPDSAVFQLAEVAKAGPGNRLPNTVCPVMTMRANRPLHVQATISESLMQIMAQNTYALLTQPLNPQQAANYPKTMGMNPKALQQERLLASQFAPEVLVELERLGQELDRLPETTFAPKGMWVGIQRTAGGLQGGVTPVINGRAEGY